MKNQLRAVSVRVTILDGHETLSRGTCLARDLWNTALSDQKSSYRQQNFFPHKFDQQKRLRRISPGNRLSDRCFSTVISEVSSAVQSFQSRCKQYPTASFPCHTHRPRSLTFELGRNAKVSGAWTFRLTILTKKHTSRHATVKLTPPSAIKIVQIKHIVIKTDFSGFILYRPARPPMPTTGTAVAAIDLGVINLATVAFSDGESILYSGRGLLSEIQWLNKRIKACKPSAWHKGLNVRRFSAHRIGYQRRIGHIRHLALHNLSHHLINLCQSHEVGTLLIGDLTHIHRHKSYGRKVNQALFAWAFAKLTRLLTYKAEAVGIQVVSVNEAYSSVACHRCGRRGKRIHRGLFHCPNCELSINADLNAAFNLLNRRLDVPVFPKTKNPRIISPTTIAKFDLKTFQIKNEL